MPYFLSIISKDYNTRKTVFRVGCIHLWCTVFQKVIIPNTFSKDDVGSMNVNEGKRKAVSEEGRGGGGAKAGAGAGTEPEAGVTGGEGAEIGRAAGAGVGAKRICQVFHSEHR